jgi:hypothetical protein
MKRDGVCNPVTNVFHIVEVFKRSGRDCKPRPASLICSSFIEWFYALS